MGKIFLTDVKGEYGVKALVGEGQMLKFAINGKCLGVFPLTFNIGSMQEVDIVSVLMERNNIELAYNIGEEFGKIRTNKSLADVGMLLNTQKGVIFVVRREDQTAGIKFTQYLYIFMRGSVNKAILE